MINPRFALAVAVTLALIFAYVGYLVFGNALASILRPQEVIVASSPLPADNVALATPAPPTPEAPVVVLPTETLAPPANSPAAEASPQATDTPLSPPDVAVPIPTATQVSPVEQPTKAPTEAPPAPTDTAVPVAPTEVAEQAPSDYSRTVDGKFYDAYVDAATKTHQYYHYTCEFDAAWVVLKTNGIDVTLQDQIDIVGLDTSIEPTYEETADGYIVHGGDIFSHYSGDYTSNFLARSTGRVVRKIFENYGLNVTAVNTREDMEAALRRGELVWVKTTADFKPGKPVTWIMPNGETYETVLGNDHAAVVMGYSERGALIRDVLGPTNTNWNRTYEYEVPWAKFMAAWGQQQYDGLAVGKP